MDLRSRQTSIPTGVWVFITAFAVRLLVLIHLSNSPYFLPDSGDMKFYNDWALNILKGHLTDGQAFYGLPGYAFFLAGIYAVAGYSPFVVGLLQVAAEAATTTLIFQLSKEIFRERGGAPSSGNITRFRLEIVGALAALGWTFFQPAQTFSVILMPTCWLVLVYWGCVWLVSGIRRVSVWHPWLWLGVVTGIVAMIVATVLFLIPLILAAIVLKLDAGKAWGARLPKMLAAAALLFAGVFAGMSPCWIHNYFVAREPVLLSAHSGVNFYIGNNANANGYPKIPPGLRAGQEGMLKDSITMAEAAEGRKLKRVEVSHFWSAKADAYIHGHFGDWLKLMGVKFKNFWNSYQYDDLSMVTLFEEGGIITPGLKFGIVAVLAIPGIFIAGWKYRKSRWVIAAIFLHMAALMPVFVTERYRLAAVPGLLLMASIGLWEFWSFLAQSRWRPIACYAAGTAASVLFVAQRPDDVGLWSLDYYNTGLKAIDSDNIDRAQKNLETAFAYVPENSEINFALGNLWLKKDDRTKAKLFYRRAIEINGRHSSAYNNLAVLALEEQRWTLAETFLLRSLKIEPGDAKVYFLLARARLGSGNASGAYEAIKQALALKPEQKEFQELAGEIAGKLNTP